MKIKIKDLTFKCIIGILPFERVTKQKVVINVSFKYKYEKDFFIDYSHIATYIEKTMKKRKFELIEEALIHLTSKLKSKYPIEKLIIKISKPNILDNCIVSVTK